MTEPGRILIADDEESVVLTTAALLAEEGFVCDHVPNAEGALALLAARDYDLLITDWKMTGNADLELVLALAESRRDLPIILLTGYPQLPETLRRRQLAVFAQLVKPFEFDELLELVREGVARHRAGQSSPAAP